MKYGIKSPYGNILGTGLRKVINSLVSAVKISIKMQKLAAVFGGFGSKIKENKQK